MAMHTLPLRRRALPALVACVALSSACAAPTTPEPPPPLRGVVWQLGADGGPGREPAHIRLDEKEPRFTGYGGCNRIMGRVVLDGPRLAFEAIAGTRRACLQEDGAEDRFLAALAGVRGWRIEGGVLKLLSASGGTLLDLRPGQAPR
jgi:putative lipoprotein